MKTMRIEKWQKRRWRIRRVIDKEDLSDMIIGTALNIKTDMVNPNVFQ